MNETIQEYIKGLYGEDLAEVKYLGEYDGVEYYIPVFAHPMYIGKPRIYYQAGQTVKTLEGDRLWKVYRALIRPSDD